MLEITRRAVAPFLLVACLLAGACASGGGPGSVTGATDADAPILLRWTWTEGETIRLRHVAETDGTVVSTMMPEPIATRSTQTAEITQEVVEVSEDGVATVRLVYDKLTVSMEGVMGEGQTWSSDDPPPEAGADDEDPMDQLGRAMSSMVGHAITLRLDDRGKLLAVEGFDELWDRAAESLGDDPMARQIQETMGEMFSEDSVRKMVGQGMVSFPDEPVAPGDTWDDDASYEIPMLGAVTQRQTYRFDRVEGDDVVLGIEARIEPGEDSGAEALPLPPEVAEMMDFRMDIRRGDFQGEVLFDRMRGQLERHELTGEIEMTMTMTPKTDEASQMMPEPMVMEMAMTIHTIYERIPGE
jgi:hypothetical protein